MSQFPPAIYHIDHTFIDVFLQDVSPSNETTGDSSSCLLEEPPSVNARESDAQESGPLETSASIRTTEGA